MAYHYQPKHTWCFSPSLAQVVDLYPLDTSPLTLEYHEHPMESLSSHFRLSKHHASTVHSATSSPMSSSTGDGEAVRIEDELTIQKALDIARNTEGPVDVVVTTYLDHKLRAIWEHIEAEPEAYILTKDEFALFNFYRHRATSSTLAQAAIRRFWDNYTATNTQ